MKVLTACVALVAALIASRAGAISSITTTKGDNGTTLPFERHIIRLGPSTAGAGILIAAIQRNGANSQGLEMFESFDLGQSWSHIMSIQGDYTVRSVADLLPDDNGQGFSLVYGTEPQSSKWYLSSRLTVVFLHYTLGTNGQISADRGPVTLFTPTSTQGYFRPALTRDSTGTLHVTASLDDNGNFSWWERMSIDGGQEWTPATQIASFGNSMGSGRTVAFGTKVMAVYDAYRSTDPGRYRIKDAGACTTWGSEVAFASPGLYHAGAFSLTVTPDGIVHLGNSDKNNQQLWYREFNGTSWSTPIKIESTGIWSNQPALSHQGNDIFFSWNHPDSTTTNRIFMKKRVSGSWSSTIVLDSNNTQWDGYTTALENVFPGEPLQVLYSWGPADSSSAMTTKDAQYSP